LPPFGWPFTKPLPARDSLRLSPPTLEHLEAIIAWQTLLIAATKAPQPAVSGKSDCFNRPESCSPP
jgi:hypothetical protein